MTHTVRNFDDLKDAVFEYTQKKEGDEPLVLIVKMPGDITLRFVITQHGIARLDCDKEGRVLA
jgi:hypothetical protein